MFDRPSQVDHVTRRRETTSVNENHNSQVFVPSTFYISLFYKLKNNWSNYPCLLCWTFYIFYPNYTLCVYFLFFILLCWTAELYLIISGLFKSSRFWINIFENQEYFVFKKTKKRDYNKNVCFKKMGWVRAKRVKLRKI